MSQLNLGLQLSVRSRPILLFALLLALVETESVETLLIGSVLEPAIENVVRVEHGQIQLGMVKG